MPELHRFSMPRRSRLLTLAGCVALAWIFASAGAAPACTIPVFRYALERWELTPYQITVFHEGPLPDDVETLVEQLEAGTPKTNSKVTRVDVSEPMPPEVDKLWRRQDAKSLPWFVVRLADADETQPDAWAGPLTTAALTRVVDSKARQVLLSRLSRGVSAVFVLLESGNKDDDEAAAKLLETELPRITPLLKLPEQSAEGPQLLTALPLRVSFTTLRLSRDDPAEQGLVRMLLGSEADLDKVRGPIVFPVFGRGRALCSLFGDDLTGEQLHQVGRFLCGECSCTVKELNPGVDLLVAADWPMLLREAEAALADAENGEPTSGASVEAAFNEKSQSPAPQSSAPPTVPPTNPPDKPETPEATTTAPITMVPAEPASSPAPVAARASNEVRWGLWLTAIGAACVLVLLTGVWAFSARKQHSPTPGS